jgi:DNA-binding NarL/FixJ family response regulator
VDKLVGTEPVRALTDLTAGVLEAAAGRHEVARTLLEDAVDRYQRCRAPFETATARVELAASLAALGRTELAAQEATRALETLERLDAECDAARARRLREIVAQPSLGPTRSVPVTSRELEVLVLLTEGLTNRQIAERLVVSEHTVHRHVTSILRKLDLPSRTAAAAFAARSGLLDDDRR